MDTYEYSVVLIEISTSISEVQRLSSCPQDFVYGGNTYAPAPSLKHSPATITGDFSREDYKIENVPVAGTLIPGLAEGYPYSKVQIAVREVFFDGSDVETDTDYLFDGFLYQVDTQPHKNTISITAKNLKYYSDVTAGIPCTELCAAPVFGDAFICKKVVYSETHTIAGVSGYEITLTGPLVDTTDFLFNQGVIANGEQRLKVKHHETGLVFQMDKRVPSSWDGAVIELYAGCDRTLTTCRDIHNNEERFLGLGISMVDYNPLYETT